MSIFSFELLRDVRRAVRPHRGFIAALLALFAATLVLCSWWLGRWTEQTNHRRQALAALGPGTRVLVAGSSHVFATINPALLSIPTMNLAAPVCSYVCVEAIVRGNLPKVPGLEALVIELDVVPAFYDTLAAYRGDYRQFLELDPDIGAMPIESFQKYELWRDLWLERSPIGPLLRFGKLTPAELVSRARGERAGEDPIIGPGYSNGPEIMPPEDDGPARVARHLREARGLSELPKNEAALRRLIELARARGLKLALMRFPHHPGYWRALPGEWQESLDALLARLGAEYPGEFVFWDFGELGQLGEGDYRNGDHVNHAAAARVTALFEQRLEQLLGRDQSARSVPARTTAPARAEAGAP